MNYATERILSTTHPIEHERISSAMDGELTAHEYGDIARLCQQTEQAAQWHDWHAIRDALQQTPYCASIADRVAQQLALEPTILSPQRKPHRFSHVAMPLAASLAAVVVVGWSALHFTNLGNPSPATLATLSTPLTQVATVSHIQQASIDAGKIDQARLNRYMAAHRDFATDANSPLMDASYQVPAGSNQ